MCVSICGLVSTYLWFSNFISFRQRVFRSRACRCEYLSVIFYKQLWIIVSFVYKCNLYSILKMKKKNKITNSARKTDLIFKHDCKRISTNCFYSWYRINASPPVSKCCDEFLIFCRKRKEKFAIYKLRKSFLLEWRVIALSYSVGIF